MRSNDADKQQRHFVIVDPYSSGLFLVDDLRQQGYPLIGVQSSQELADFWLKQFDESLFVHTIKHESLETTIKALREFNVVVCIAGSEPGVYLAEDIQEELKLEKRNGADTKTWRRNKLHQQARLRDCGIRSIRQTFAATVEECLEWQKQWAKWPIIIKPAEGGGNDGVNWCHNEQDCYVAFRNECGKFNVNGMFNDKLLCQEFLEGPEYIIDCVSDGGKHVLNGIWEYYIAYKSMTRSIIPLGSRLLPSRGEVQDKLVDYIFKALTALGIKYGPSHSEAIIVDGEPCLVECGARMQGMKGPKMMQYATGLGVPELVVDVYAHGGRLFKELLEREYRYIITKHAYMTCFNNTTKQGILTEDVDLSAAKNLPSVIDAFINVRKGDMLEYTRDMATSPGLVMHIHPCLDQIISDNLALRMLEKTDEFYHVETELGSGKIPLHQGTDQESDTVDVDHSLPTTFGTTNPKNTVRIGSYIRVT